MFFYFFFKGISGQSLDRISRTPGTHIGFTPGLPYVQARAGDPLSGSAQGSSDLSGQ